MKIPKVYVNLEKWLQSIIRNGKISDYVLIENIDDGIDCQIFTKENRYSITAKIPDYAEYLCECKEEIAVATVGGIIEEVFKCEKCGNENAKLIDTKGGYLGCIATERKPRAGEDWSRGNDLADGEYCVATWESILKDIVSYEMVKIANKSVRKNIEFQKD